MVSRLSSLQLSALLLQLILEADVGVVSCTRCSRQIVGLGFPLSSSARLPAHQRGGFRLLLAAPAHLPSWHLLFQLKYCAALARGSWRFAAQPRIHFLFITWPSFTLNSDPFGISKGDFHGKRKRILGMCAAALHPWNSGEAPPIPTAGATVHSSEGCGANCFSYSSSFSPAFGQTESLCPNPLLHLITCWQCITVLDYFSSKLSACCVSV